jgi:hypothetical protein
MPSVASTLLDLTAADSDHFSHPESTPLYLPSSLSAAFQCVLPGGLVVKETRMRIAQADDALAELRRLLRITMSLRNYQHTQLGPSQHAATRARSIINRFREKVNRCVERYHAAYSALTALNPGGEWVCYLQELKPEDVKPPLRMENESERKRELSWIWMESKGRDNTLESEASEEEIGDCKSGFFFSH